MIKLDIEGEELNAIIGSKNIIKKNDNIKIIFELNIGNNKNGLRYAKKIFFLLGKLNFKFFKLLLNDGVILSKLNRKNFVKIKNITQRYNVNVLAYK